MSDIVCVLRVYCDPQIDVHKKLNQRIMLDDSTNKLAFTHHAGRLVAQTSITEKVVGTPKGDTARRYDTKKR